jgi:syntaxin 18
LHGQLGAIRPSYISPSTQRRFTPAVSLNGLTEREREEIDVTAKRSIRELTASIQALQQGAALLHTTDIAAIRRRYEQHYSMISTWVSGMGSTCRKTKAHVRDEDAVSMIATHRDNIVIYLKYRLEACCKLQQDMMEKRLARETEKNKSLLARTKNEQTSVDPTGAIHTDSRFSAFGHKTRISPVASDSQQRPDRLFQDLPPQQIQKFEMGNLEMMQNMRTDIQKLESAHHSLVEITQLQNTLMGSLMSQKGHIEMLTEQQDTTEHHLEVGNKELSRAARRSSPARGTFIIIGCLSSILLVWDMLM